MKYSAIVYLSLISGTLLGQSYFTAGGVRLGTENGLTVQQRIFKHTTLEGILLSGFKTDYISAGIQLQRHYPLLFKNLNIYTGMGLQTKYLNHPELKSEKYSGVSISGGIEMSLGRVNVSWDYKPVIYFNGQRAYQSESGLSLRYIFISNKSFKKHQRQSKKKRSKKHKRKNDKKGLFGTR